MSQKRPLRLSPIEKTDLRDLAADRLRRLIIHGDLQPGSPLVEDEIAESLQMSRTPVRDALMRMQAEGLAEPRGKKGLAVSLLRQQDVAQIYPLIAAIERMALLDCAPFSAAKTDKLEALNARFSEVEDDPNELIKFDGKWHSALLEDSRNKMAVKMLVALKAAAERYDRTFFILGAHIGHSVHEHHEVATLIADGDLGAAADVLESHWLSCMEPLAGGLPDA